MVWLRASAQAEAFPTGYSTLDSATGGFMRGAVAVTAGWPGGGKTDFAINLAMRMGGRGAGGQVAGTEAVRGLTEKRESAIISLTDN